MKDAGPARPQVRRRAVGVVVHVDVVAAAHLGVAVGKLVDVAREMIIAHHLVQGVAVVDRVVRIGPVRVLEDDGLAGDAVGERVQLLDRLEELLPVDVHVLLLGEQVVQVVEDEEVAFLRVAAHHDVALFKVARRQRTFRRLVQEGAVHDRHERELEDAQRSHLFNRSIHINHFYHLK